MNIIKCVLELFLNVFLIISKTYLEYNVSHLIYGTYVLIPKQDI